MRTLCTAAALVLAALAVACAEDHLEDAVGSIRTSVAQQPTAGAPPDTPGVEDPTQDPEQPPDGGEEPVDPEEPPPDPDEGQPPPAEGEPPAVEEGEAEDGANIPWTWIILGAGLAVLVPLLLSWWGRRRQARRAKEGEWQAKALDVYSNAAAIHDTLRAEFASEATGAAEAEAAAQRWRETERRMDELAVALHRLEASSPSDRLSEPVRAVLSAQDMLRSAGQASVSLRRRDVPAADAQLQEAAALARQRLSEFNDALQALRLLV